MALLRPVDSKLRMRKPGFWVRIHVSLYKAALKRLQKSYRYYAVYDVVSLDGGAVKLVHEYRDLAFENELLRNKIIDGKSQGAGELVHKVERKGSRFLFRYFDFVDILTIYADGKEIRIRRDECLSVDGNTDMSVIGKYAVGLIMGADVKASGVLEHFGRKSQKRTNETFRSQDLPKSNNEPESQNESEPRKHRRRTIKASSLFEGEQLPLSEAINNTEIIQQSPSPVKTETTKVRGIEIDNDF